MTMSDSSYRGTGNSTIAATFPDRSSAHNALTDLHDAGFRNVWLGVTHDHGSTSTGTGTSSGVTVASEDAGGFMESLGRFFTGEGAEEQALHQALVNRGLSDAQARGLESTVPAGAAIVTVDGENDPAAAIEILQSNGGTVDTSYIGSVSSATTSSASVANTAAAATAAGTSDIDDARRLQLREERLSINKERVSSGEARIGKEVVSERQSIDVPVFREELFIQRRPVSEGTVSTTPIGDGEEIRIPLSEERVDVQKRTVVTEEVVFGKGKVEDTEHVSDTIRREELRVDDGVTKTDTLQQRPR